MEPITFEEANVVIAKDQKEYRPLPAYIDYDDTQGQIISCWGLTWKEKLSIKEKLKKLCKY